MEGTDMGSARPLPFAGTELAHDPTTHRAASSASPRTEPAKVGDPNSAPPSARVEPDQGRGKVATRGDPAKHVADEDWQTALPDCRLHGRRAGSPGSTSRSAHWICHPNMNGWRACPARGARMTLVRRKPRESVGRNFARKGGDALLSLESRKARRVGARERHQSSGSVSQGTCLHDLLSCRNPEDRSRRCGDCLSARPLRGPGGRRRDGLGKGHRPPAPGTGFGGCRRSTP